MFNFLKKKNTPNPTEYTHSKALIQLSTNLEMRNNHFPFSIICSGLEWEMTVTFQQKPMCQPQASLCLKSNIFIPFLMEQISNRNMYSKIIEAMRCQHIRLPSGIIPQCRAPTEQDADGIESLGNAETSDSMEERGSGEEATSVLLPLGCSKTCLEEIV